MAPRIVEGIYGDGRIRLDETPEGLAEGTRVQVVFPEPTVSEAERQAAWDRARARMEEGFPLGGGPYPRREELYDRTYRFDQGNRRHECPRLGPGPALGCQAENRAGPSR